ncbi:MAG: archease [Brevefilum sp.]|nr:archease [Brevefilum sp.]
MASHGYQEVDHTADIALRVWGEDFYTLLRQAAYGLNDLLGVVLHDTPVEVFFALQQDSVETLLVDFLSELLFLAEEKEQLFDSFLFDEHDDGLTVQMTGRKILSQDRHVKAVTFHYLDVAQTDCGFEVTITFDV